MLTCRSFDIRMYWSCYTLMYWSCYMLMYWSDYTRTDMSFYLLMYCTDPTPCRYPVLIPLHTDALVMLSAHADVLVAFCALITILLLSLIPLASAVFITLHVDIYEIPLLFANDSLSFSDDVLILLQDCVDPSTCSITDPHLQITDHLICYCIDPIVLMNSSHYMLIHWSLCWCTDSSYANIFVPLHDDALIRLCASVQYLWP
jgi:hypothetical protein